MKLNLKFKYLVYFIMESLNETYPEYVYKLFYMSANTLFRKKLFYLFELSSLVIKGFHRIKIDLYK